MPIYEFGPAGITPLEVTTFGTAGMQERRDLQRLLRENIKVIAPETLVISEEFGDWEDSRRRIDLLGIDKAANLVVIELKRTEDGGYMELQAIRYASMVATMKFDQAVEAYGSYLLRCGRQGDDPRTLILQFLGWVDADDSRFAQDVRIILASADFSRELTSSVLWLNKRDLDIQCVRLTPYRLDGRVLVDVQPIIPLPETADYQVKLREKERTERVARATSMDRPRFNVQIGSDRYPDLPKGRAILLICRYLCQNGISPEDIAGHVPRSTQRMICALDGVLGAVEFRSQVDARGFDPRRWFYGAADLVVSNGKTYAFSNQWGADDWRDTMDRLCSAYPQFNIRFSETS